MSDQKEATSEKKVTPFNLATALGLVLVIQLASLWITNTNRPIYVAVGPVTVGPFTNSTPTGSVGDAITLVLLVFATTLVLVWLIRRKLMTSFKTVVFAAVSFSAFTLTWFTVDGVFSKYSWYSSSFVLPAEILIALIPVVIVGYTVFVKSYAVLSTVVLGLISAEVGSFFAATLPPTNGVPLMALLLALVFAVYDIYAVFRGPLKQLVSIAPSDAFAAMSVKAGEFTVGLGDVVFYSMLPSVALFYLQPLSALYTLVAVDLGVVLTLFLLTRRRLLPGLPIPMLLGICVLAGSFL
jgi:hypothetical protein